MSSAPRPAVPASAFIGFAIAVVGLAVALIAAMSALSSQQATTAKLAATLDSLRVATQVVVDTTANDALRADLVRHSELIPVPGTAGSHQFFPAERIRVINDRWAYAYFEDGHVGGDMLLEYETKGGVTHWRVLTWRRF